MGTQADVTERDRRLARIREAMEREGLEALLVAGKGHGWTGRGYFRYLTDFHLWGHDGLILVPLEGEPVLTLTSAGVASMVAKRGWITDARGDWDIAPEVVREMKRRGLTRGRVGIAGLQFIMSVGTFEILRDGLPEVQFVKADALMNRIRAIKSPLEIQQYRELWAIAKEAMELFVQNLRPGMTEREASSEPVRFIHTRGARDYLIFINGHIPGDIQIKLEDILSYHMEICNESGHWCELTVILAYRQPTADELRLMETEIRAYEEVRKIAKPGVSRLNDLAMTFERVLREDGWKFTDEKLHHYDFHGQGLDWIEWPTWSPNDPERHDTVLEEGMVINYHPYRNVIPQVRRTGINDDMLVTADGGVRLSGDDWDFRWRVMV